MIWIRNSCSVGTNWGLRRLASKLKLAYYLSELVEIQPRLNTYWSLLSGMKLERENQQYLSGGCHRASSSFVSSTSPSSSSTSSDTYRASSLLPSDVTHTTQHALLLPAPLCLGCETIHTLLSCLSCYVPCTWGVLEGYLSAVFTAVLVRCHTIRNY